MTGGASVGLYSISVRGLNVPELLAWAFAEHIPFVHLRGGRRGFDLAACEPATLRYWREIAATTVPITGVTADTDVADLLSADPTIRRQAHGEVGRLADAALALGAGWLRVLARRPISHALAADARRRMPECGVSLLVELHHENWLQDEPFAALACLLEQQPRLRLLADTTQLADALTHTDTSARLEQVLAWADVVHLSDAGTVPRSGEHDLVIELAAYRLVAGHRFEVAVELTGADRTQRACLARYRAHTAQWARLCEHARERS